MSVNDDKYARLADKWLCAVRERNEARVRCERLAQRVEQIEAELEATKRERTEASK